MHSETAFVLTVLVLCYAAVSGLVRRWYLAPALIFVVLGIVLGPSCLGLIEAGSDTKGFTVLSELALTMILFNQASTLNLRTVFRRGHLPMRLMAIGIPVTIALNTAIAVSALPVLRFWEAVCLAVIVAPTEVSLLDALLEDRRIPERVRHALSIESGLYDGLALAALLAALTLASEQTHPAPVRWAWFAFRTEFASLAVGIAALASRAASLAAPVDGHAAELITKGGNLVVEHPSAKKEAVAEQHRRRAGLAGGYPCVGVVHRGAVTNESRHSNTPRFSQVR